MNALFLKDLAIKTHRGIEGRVRHGKSGGGRAYGYRVAHQPAEDGNVTRGDREIVEAEAAIVRRIFAEFATGKSPRAMRGTSIARTSRDRAANIGAIRRSGGMRRGGRVSCEMTST